MASKTKKQLLEEAQALGMNFTEDTTIKDIQAAIDAARVVPAPADEPVAVVEPPAPAKSEGSEIAQAITKGMENVGKSRPIKITADKSVQSIFAVVRSKTTGELMIRENSTGVLSKIQLRSLEEQEASMQNEEVEDIV
jgi:hypothetical protein